MSGQLADRLMHFARLLRAAGMAVGSDRVMLGLQALQVAGLASKGDLHAVLSACLLDRIEHRELFDQAFDLFWRAPAEGWSPLQAATASATPPRALPQRLADALQAPATPTEAAGRNTDAPDTSPGDANAALSWNEAEALRSADFDSMSADEWAQAQRLLSKLHVLFPPLPSRRSRPAASAGPAATADWRATLQHMARHGGELLRLRWRQRRTRPAPLLLLVDISGSMSQYSRMLLHFAHTLANVRSAGTGDAPPRVESFVFGTRLTRTTRLLKNRDPDAAVAQVVRAVQDWSGGTRITASLHEFNQRWARRVLTSQATVLLISDGLEAGDTQQLGHEMERLHMSCKRLIWLNPLLRFAQFAPKAGGIRAMLPHVDQFLPTHNLRSLEHLAELLNAPASRASIQRPTGASDTAPQAGQSHHATHQPTNPARHPGPGLGGAQ